MTEAFNGRIQAYDRDGDLEQAIRRNVYGTVTPSDEQVRLMARYLRAIRLALAGAPFRDICDGGAMKKLPEPTQETLNATS